MIRLGLSRPKRSVLLRYGVAVGLVLIATGLRLSLQPVLRDSVPLFTMPYAVFLAAYFGGIGPGALATFLGDGISAYLFMQPVGSMRVENLADQLALGSFFCIGMLISVLTDRSRRFREQALTAELALAESRYLSLVLQSPEPILVLGEGEIRVINVRAVDTLSPGGKHHFGGTPFLNLVHRQDRELTREWLRTLRPGTSLAPAPVRLMRADGTPIEVALTADLLVGMRPRVQLTLSGIHQPVHELV